MTTHKTGVLLIGAGGIGRAYLDAAARLESDVVRIVGVVDFDSAALSRVPESIPTFDTLDVALQKSNFEAALICTPPKTHLPLILELLDSGVAVICEKPIVPSIAEFAELADGLEADDSRLTMASKFRFVPDVQRAREMVATGVLGQVLQIEVAFGGVVPMANRWNSNAAISGGGVLADNGPHAFDLVRQFGQAVEAVQWTSVPKVQPLDVEDSVLLSGTAESGAAFSVALSWSINWQLPYYLRVFGSEAMLELGWQQSRLKRNGEDWQAIGDGYDKFVALGAQLIEARTLAAGEPTVVNLSDARHAVAAVDAAYASRKSGRAERLRANPNQLSDVENSTGDAARRDGKGAVRS